MSEAVRVRRAKAKEGASHAPDGSAHASSSGRAHGTQSSASPAPAATPSLDVTPSFDAAPAVPVWAPAPIAPALTLGAVQRKAVAGEVEDLQEREAEAVTDTVLAAPEPSASGVQRKPVIGERGDAYEREADAVADRVVSGLDAPAFGVTRLGPAGPAGPPRAVAPETPAAVAPAPPVQAMEAEEEPEQVLPAAPVQAMEIAAADQDPPDATPPADVGAPSPVQRKETDDEPVDALQRMEAEEEPEEVLPLQPVQAMEIAAADQEPPPDDTPSIQRAEKDEEPVQLSAKEEEPVQLSEKDLEPVQLSEKDDEPVQLAAEDEEPVRLKEKEDEPVQRAAEGASSAPAPVAPVSAPAARPTLAPGGPASRATAPVLAPRPAAPVAFGINPTRPAAPVLVPRPAPAAPVRASSTMQDAAAAAIASPGAGRDLPAATRGVLELRMGVDLGSVRIHDGPDAQRSAALLNARAFTHGRHIWLGRGESAGDLRLMAHEVTHVLQQDGVVRRKPADKKAPAGGSGGSAPAGGSSGAAPAPAPAAPAPAPAPAAPAAVPGEPLMPEPPEGLSAEEQARLNQVDQKAGEAVEATTDLPPAEEQVGEARGAVAEPAAETRARAGDALVDALGNRPEPSPEIEELCVKIRTAIRNKRPPDEDSLVAAKPEEMAKDAGGQMNASVEGDAKRVQGQYDELKTPPAGTPAQEATPMGAPPPAAAPPSPGATAATPDGVTPDKVSLDADVAAGARQMDDAGMNSEPAKLVDSGPIADARAAQGELAETAARDPQEVLAEQQGILANAQADMAALQANALAALQSGRAETTSQGRSQQSGMVGSEEQMRTKAAADAQSIFDSAQKRVDGLLEPLPRTAMAKWDAGVKLLSTEFEQSLARVKKWIDERHESTVLAVWDAVTGLPDWVTEEYDRAEKKFGDGVCELIREISSEVNGVIAACETIIDTSRKDIAAVFAALPAELQGWAAEQQAQFGERLNGLADKAAKTKADFTRDLTAKAAQAVQEVREKVHALREAAKGLLGKLADAVNAFLEDPAKFIIDGLLKLVGIAPGAFWALVDRISAAIDSIANDPMNFANNLMAALGKGFQQFFDNIGSHLLKGLLDWLFSGLGSVGVQIPSDTSLKSIITFFLQLMGLSWANIRKILAKHVGEKNVALIEKAWELISMLIEKGPEGIFEMVKEQLDPANLLSMVLEAATDYLIEALIKAVTPRIIGLFNPAGAIIQAIEAIFRVLQWIFNNAARIFSLVETIVGGVTDLIAGNIGGMANAVEGALARLITPVIDFLAGYLGLGGLPEKIASVIKGFQTRVLAIVDKVIGFLAKKAKDLLKAMGIGGKDEVDENDPEKAKKVAAGLTDIDVEEGKVLENGKLTRDEAKGVAARVRKNHPVFTALTVVDGGDSWNYRWKASPGDVKETSAQKEEEELMIVSVVDSKPPGGSAIGALDPASDKVRKAAPGTQGAATAFEQEVGDSLGTALGVPVPGGKSRWPALTGTSTGLPADTTVLKEPKTNMGGKAKAGDLYRNPDWVVLSPGGQEQVEVFEVTLDVNFQLQEGATSHKRAQIAGTVFGIAMRYPKAPIIYNIRAPHPPSAKAKEELEIELRKFRKANMNVQFIWRHG